MTVTLATGDTGGRRARRTSTTATRRPWTSLLVADPETLVVPQAGEVLFRWR